MTVDIRCPHCGKETDYNLNYNETYCNHCHKEITYKEMYEENEINVGATT